MRRRPRIIAVRVISFCLWGSIPRYTLGAIRNAELAQQLYPGWICRFHVGTSVPRSIVEGLRAQPNTDVREREEPGDYTSMFWRFLPAHEEDVEILLSRDTDSRLLPRERAAVDEWLESNKSFHIMRDHPWHGTPILGGMWGARRAASRIIAPLIDRWDKQDQVQTDQEFLRDWIFPQIERDSLVHDEFRHGVPFPKPRADGEFVGAACDEHGAQDPEQTRALLEALSTQSWPALQYRLKRAAFHARVWPMPARLRPLARRVRRAMRR